MEKAQSIIDRVKKPTEAQAKALASYFPSTSSRKRRLEPFDPSAECVVLSQQKKKKAAIKGKLKTHSVTVVMMKAFERSVPKGKKRQKLFSEGRIQTLKLTRCMNACEVNRAIIRAFSSLEVSSFVVLACDVNVSGHNLSRASDQNVDGEMTTQRRGCLYLCEELKVGYIICYTACLILQATFNDDCRRKMTWSKSAAMTNLMMILSNLEALLAE